MHIRLYEGTDHAPLAQAFAELYRHYFADAAPPYETILRALEHEVLAPEASIRVAVAEDGPEIAGLATFAILYPAPGSRGQLFMKDLFVRAAWRGHGVGERLMGFLARHAVAQGCVRLDWTTETGNPGAIGFYERLGASRVAEKIYFRLAGEALTAFAARSPGQ